MNYIFGYGSLICQDSRSRTGVSGEAHAIEVQGIQRKWSLQSPEWPATAVGAHEEATARCNGVYFHVDEQNLERFDEREQGYRRTKLSWHNVSQLSPQPLPSHGTLWAYVGEGAGQPSPERPIMQSYLDVILNGCLDFGEAFAVAFTQTTECWQHLVNDRDNPQYPRPLTTLHRIPTIEAMLETHLPSLLRNRKPYR